MQKIRYGFWWVGVCLSGAALNKQAFLGSFLRDCKKEQILNC